MLVQSKGYFLNGTPYHARPKRATLGQFIPVADNGLKIIFPLSYQA
jgi:hypothetical protein